VLGYRGLRDSKSTSYLNDNRAGVALASGKQLKDMAPHRISKNLEGLHHLSALR
jgi:hypothetical protein